MRPVYEGAEDRERQAAVARVLEGAWRCQLVDMPKLSSVDYVAICDGSLRALVEIKCRKIASSAYPDYLLSDAKARCMERIAESLRIRPILVVQWSDMIGCVDIASAPYRADEGGRKDRADVTDIERCRFYPITSFKRVSA